MGECLADGDWTWRADTRDPSIRPFNQIMAILLKARSLSSFELFKLPVCLAVEQE